MKSTAMVAMLVAVALIAGCSHSDQPENNNDSQVAAKKAVPATATMPVVKPTTAPAPSAAPHSSTPPRWLPSTQPDGAASAAFKTIGVPACDQFGLALQQCLPNMRGLSRDNTQRLFDRQLDYWQKQLNSGTSAADVANQCTTFATQWSRRLHSMGCRL